MNTAAYKLLRERLQEIAHLNSCLALLQWDQEVFMPPKGGASRADTISYMSVLTHKKILALNEGGVLTSLQKKLKAQPNKSTSIVVREAGRTYQREQKLPEMFVREMSSLCSLAQTSWAESRKKETFAIFLPKLKRLIQLKRQEAEYVGYKDSPYDALLDAYEPGLTSKQLTGVFNELQDFLIPFIKTLQKSAHQPPKATITKGSFPLEEQQSFNTFVAEKMGFRLDAGRLDISTHPFTTSFHPQDVRLTTRYDKADLLYALGSTIHEVGPGFMSKDCL